ncbi:MAG: NUDIX hydrolase [Ruminococcus sp.]|jgi:ADP-ribose pyrophosphatase|nr:NUDIX hydrolase [Ruminococcus sp.]
MKSKIPVDHNQAMEEISLATEEIYNGSIINVRRDIVLTGNMKQAFREVVEHGGGVAVAALTDKNEMLFVKQFRYPFGEALIEIPAGKLEKGEDPAKCGLRELKEETGAIPSEFFPLTVIYPTVAYCTEKIHIFCARGLRFTKTKFDEDEFIELIKIPLEKAVEMVENGEIKDAKTVAAILLTHLKSKPVTRQD